jgi:nucleoside-diphosphate-sugar epimerase
MNQKVLLLGGPGKIGKGTLQKILNQNFTVGIFKRSSNKDEYLDSKVRFYYGDRNSSTDIEFAITDFRPDVVIDFVCFTPAQANIISGLVEGRVAQYIFISTCDVYGFPLSCLPMKETDPWRKTNSVYAENKRLCEEFFTSRFHPSRFPLTISRPAYSMANDFVLTAFSRDGGKYLIPRLKAGYPILVPGDGTTLIQPGVAINTGHMIARLIGNEKTIGKSYTCGHPTFMSHDEYISLFADYIKVKPNIIHIPTDLLYSLNTPEIHNSILEDITRYNIAFSMEKFLVDFPDFIWEVSLDEAVKEYIDYNNKMNLFASLDEVIYEDRIIKKYEEMSAIFSSNIL